MSKLVDMTGERVGRLVVIRRVGRCATGATWECICDCGNKTVVSRNNLISNTKSCGCLENEWRKSGNAWRSHGLSKTPEWYTWYSMRQRCYNANSTAYSKYGARGISICKRWDSFENFIADMGNKPTPSHTIDRIDNGGNYEPSNCRWATKSEQALNRRPKSFGRHNQYSTKIK